MHVSTTLQNVLPGFSPAPLDYREAWELQRTLHRDVVQGLAGPGYLVALEHPPTYTAGRRTQAGDRPTDGTPVIDVDRGGLLTWHGPGQLVVYPILRLAHSGAVKDYVFRLEQAIIDTLDTHGVQANRVDGRAGVWVQRTGQPDQKIAAIGIHIEDGVTMHGLALNVSNDLEPYARIVPCGITDAGVTTLNLQAGTTLTPQDLAPELLRRLQENLDPAIAGAVTDGVHQLKEATA